MNIQGKIIVVTGGCGFIGSKLVEALLPLWPKKIIVVDNMFIRDQGGFVHNWSNDLVEVIQGDAGDENLMRGICKQGIDLIYNCAVMCLPHSLEHPVENFNNNVRITTTLLDLLRYKEYARLIHFSSSEVYGSCQQVPMSEDHPFAPSTVYAVSKMASDQLVLSYDCMYSLPAVIIRPFNNYGPGQNEGGYAGVIPRTINRLMRGEKAQIYGDGSNTRDYVFVEDTVKAAILLAGKFGSLRDGWPFPEKVFNVASGREVRIDILIHKIVDIYNKFRRPPWISQVEYCPARPADVHRHIGSGYLIEDLMGFVPTTDIDIGLHTTIEWYMKNRGLI